MRLTDAPRIGAVVSEAMAEAHSRPGAWIVCRQLVTLREWYCLFVGRPFLPLEPQLALMYLEDSRRWRVDLASGVPELAESRFRPRGLKARFPRLMVERYDP